MTDSENRVLLPSFLGDPRLKAVSLTSRRPCLQVDIWSKSEASSQQAKLTSSLGVFSPLLYESRPPVWEFASVSLSWYISLYTSCIVA